MKFVLSTLLCFVFFGLAPDLSGSIPITPNEPIELMAAALVNAAVVRDSPKGDELVQLDRKPKGSKAKNKAPVKKTKTALPAVKCKVTAYYKPLPPSQQQKYLHGTYSREIAVNGGGILTASGDPPEWGKISADPVLFPEGSVLRIPGYGDATVKDIGGSVKGHHVDIFVGEGDFGREFAENWGDPILKVEVIALAAKKAGKKKRR